MQKWNKATENYPHINKEQSISYVLLPVSSPPHWMVTFILRTEHAQPSLNFISRRNALIYTKLKG